MEANPNQESASDSPDVRPRRESPVSRDISEDGALALIHSQGLSAEILASIGRTPIATKSRKLWFALLSHPRTPRHLSIVVLRRMFTFDLMKVALTPAIAADLKRAAEDEILRRLESLTLGEKIALARRGPGRVVEALLPDGDERLVSAALDNSRLREASLTAALSRANAPAILFETVSRHPTWSGRREVQIMLLGSEKTPIEAVRQLAEHQPPQWLEEILPHSRRALILG